MRDRGRRVWQAAVLPLALIALWQAAASTGVWRIHYVPAPDAVVTALLTEVRSGELARAAVHTFGVVAAASAVALTAGTVAGAAIGLLPRLRRWVEASIDLLRTLPAIALIPVVVLTFGPGFDAEVILAGHVAVWPMVLNTAGAVTSVHPRYFDVARTLRLGRWRTFGGVVLPAAAPVWLVGVRLSAVLALLVTIVAEMVITSAGLGGALAQSLNALDPARMWAYALVCGIVGLALNAGLRAAVRLALPGHPSTAPTAPVSRAGIASPQGLAPVILLLLAWQFLSSPGSLTLTLPPPSSWVAALTGLHRADTLLPAVGHTLVTFAAGLAVATVAGGFLGAALGASASVDRAVSPTLDFLAAIPGAALVPVLVLLFGSDLASGVAAVAVVAAWPILLSAAAARRAIPPVRLEVGRTLGLSPVHLWLRIVLPSLVPGVLLGVRVCSAVALVIALLVDIFGSGAGIGRLLVLSQQHFDAAAAWGLLLVVGTLGYLFNVALATATRITSAAHRQVASAG